MIVTVYRREAFLAEALGSVIAQTVPDFEVLVADDSNAPELRRVVEDLGDARLRYVGSERNKGVAISVRDSLGLCRGTYVAILNDDDVWEPTFLAELLGAFAADPECVLAFSDHSIMDGAGAIDPAESDDNTRRWGRADLPAGRVADAGRVVVLNKSVPLVMGALFRRDALAPEAIVPEVGGAYDYWIAVLLAATGRPLRYVPARLTRYRVHSAMETVRGSPAKGDDELFIVGAVLGRGWFGGIGRELRARFAALSAGSAANKLRHRRRSEARAVAGAGLRSAWSFKGVLVYAATLSPALPSRFYHWAE